MIEELGLVVVAFLVGYWRGYRAGVFVEALRARARHEAFVRKWWWRARPP